MLYNYSVMNHSHHNSSYIENIFLLLFSYFIVSSLLQMNNSADAWYLLKTIIKPLGFLRRSALMK